MRQERSRVDTMDPSAAETKIQPPSLMEEASKMAQGPSQRRDELAVNETEQLDKLTPMEEAAKVHTGLNVDPYSKTPISDLIAQSQEAQSKIQALQSGLNRPDLRIRPSVQNLMDQKLDGVDNNLQVAMRKAGMEGQAPSAEAVEGVTNPIERFMGRLTHSQGQLEKMDSYFEYLQQNPDRLSPAYVLAIQIKMHHVVTEMEFFTSLLNKSLEGTKTIMQVQV
jgi:hypothetical protein